MTNHPAARQQARLHPLALVIGLAVPICGVVYYRVHRPASVRVATVARTKLKARLNATGFVEAIQARMAPPTSARIVNLAVEENAVVTAGQLLATLESKSVDAESDAARSAAVTAAAQAEGAQHAVAAMKLQAPGAIAQAQAALDAARAQFAKLENGSRPEEIATASANTNQARAALETAKAQLQRSVEALEQQQAVSDAGVREAASLLESARANERRLQSGARKQEIAQAEAQLRDTRARTELAQKELARNEKLLKGGAISQQQLDAAQTALTSARETEAAAREHLDLLKAGASKEELDAAHAEVSAAEARLRRARAAQQEVKLRQQEINAAQSQVKQAEATFTAAGEQSKLVANGARTEDKAAARAKMKEAGAALAQARSGLSQLKVRESEARAAQANAQQAGAHVKAAAARAQEYKLVAPFAGVVARRYVDAGEMVHPTTPMFLVVDLKKRWVIAELDAEELGKVHVGQEVTVTAEAFPGKTYAAKVREISPVAEPKPGGRTRARIVRMKVDLTVPAPELKPGLEVDVRAGTELRAGALVVPNDAIQSDHSDTFVFVVENGGPLGVAKRRVIKPGAHNEAETEVLSGLKEGERVIVEGKEGLVDGARVRIR